ncbi:ribosome hibernation-promoting factor, HPF/YfiA family [Bartonella apis]|uniref:ribosome hibernation-promoting factor, HPF/YfiA family n=1 Tax=Bartonella apis TaxID=1686310 RepID=UPI00242A59C4|nr:ribosome-associated translation inhibitor RaiA [Bartonella apis]MCT6823996.1 ribosome-associated translation inhibitor RaiA [Bartonella apis]MCT6860890.1 ribosome-associated translation inhibitor RaiA [Bartonella apis]MCT6886824.1 ribosome-associated translation inhibitor RaiA [Bartonella apis]MCT6918995.1 ribosome-associated translation inhibitor RaiA [Bifidobacteriales bacterium]
MSLRISGKHMDIGDAFRTRIEDRINDAISKYFAGGVTGHVTVVKSGPRFSAECVLHLSSGAVLQTTGQAQDPQGAFDAAAERLETRLRRYKRRLKSRSNKQNDNATFAEYAYHIMEPVPDEDEGLPEDYAPTIVAETSMALRDMSVANAVVELDLMDNPVLVFRNAADGKINIVYRRADGNIGWIDPSSITNKA